VFADQRLCQIIAVEPPADRWPLFIYPASSSDLAVLAPLITRFAEFLDVRNLAAKRALAAGAATTEKRVFHAGVLRPLIKRAQLPQRRQAKEFTYGSGG